MNKKKLSQKEIENLVGESLEDMGLEEHFENDYLEDNYHDAMGNNYSDADTGL